jgi:hypothetical protein
MNKWAELSLTNRNATNDRTVIPPVARALARQSKPTSLAPGTFTPLTKSPSWTYGVSSPTST